MKFIRIISLLVIGATIYSSCKSDFNPAAPYKNITVVYGLLSLSDTIHYIKIEKAFLSENGGNAYTEAQVADSIYYPQETDTAELQAYNNGSFVSTIPLTREDGATLGVNKDTGVFASNPNIVYYTKATLNASYTYNLVITNNKTGVVTSSQTVLVNNFFVENPIQGNSTKINFTSRSYFNCLWNPAVNAVLYQVIIRFHYKETSLSNSSDTSNHVITWTFPTQPTSGNTYESLSIPGSNFYSFVSSAVPVNPGVERQAKSFDFWFYAGGQALYTYQQISLATSTSLVQGQINPSYTDITNGIGLFSSTLFQPENGLAVSPNTMDSLARSSVTSQLKFVDANGNLSTK